MCSPKCPKHAACWLVALVTCPHLSRTLSPASSCSSNPAEDTVLSGSPCSAEAGREGSFQGSVDEPFTS